MKSNLIMAGALVLSLAATGCATKKYVTKTVNETVAPVEARVTASEGKNTAQDQQIATNAQEIDALQTTVSRTNERLTDVDTKATGAGTAAQRANDAAVAAQRSATGAQTAADTAKTAADNARTAGISRANEVQSSLERKVDGTNKFQMATSETVLFGLNQSVLDKDGMAKLDAIAQRAGNNQRFIIEVQGFTDKTGSPETNALLSQKRAEAVSRYLINEHKVPLRNVETIGSGYALPVADDATRDGRKQNRRVEVRLFVPEIGSAVTIAGN